MDIGTGGTDPEVSEYRAHSRGGHAVPYFSLKITFTYIRSSCLANFMVRNTDYLY